MDTKHRLGVAVHDLGGKEGPLLLLLHANGFHGRVFLPMVPILAPHFRCVSLDLPGHGSAPTPEGPFTAEDMVGAVRDYVESQGIQGRLGGGLAALLQFERPQTFRSGSLLARLARKRQAVYPTLGAAMTSLGAKPPFNTWDPQALHAYLACGGLRPLEQPGATTTAGATAPGAPALTLSCSPENEARVYEALEPPPWRPWQQLGVTTSGFGSDPRVGDCGCCGSGCGVDCGGDCGSCGNGRSQQQRMIEVESGKGGEGEAKAREDGCGDGSSYSDGSGNSNSNCHRRRERRGERDGSMGHQGPYCRIAIAVGQEVGLHAQLARWGAEVAQLVPGAKLARFPSLHHLGPMEDPRLVATTALKFFLAADDDDDDGNNGKGDGNGNHNRDSAVGSGFGSGVSSKL
ncbi:hypothetical protein VOLCADRAFT_117411 [Volvox carteri f. nagariensis]|uniref:AB hydrolase-1 domain-containing protein n=1 Tax=Volvox carteri f. nagariensis TaxID=3068 RepID=D8TU55_VOLCA|nr:uncharacterized protein VOLCADRAFT_117411 [Volvox carteri f. nagariensis]EFJ49083.1 hypothetical protein VOLCADRAFT_117411 [Volvox carteri f. nagariensis]|eukprot:XP_002949980.1 hypothetical protein VOLCADRAFT_117411 [Volvox carteri f. nagariensis]